MYWQDRNEEMFIRPMNKWASKQQKTINKIQQPEKMHGRTGKIYLN